MLIQEQRRREFVRLEKQLEDDQRQQARLAAQAAANKNHLVQFVAKVSISSSSSLSSVLLCSVPFGVKVQVIKVKSTIFHKRA